MALARGQRVRREHDRGGGVRRVLGGPVHLVGVDVAGPVATTGVAQVLHVGEQPHRACPVAERVERQHQLTGLRAGHPRVGVDTADAQPGHHEVVPARVDQRPPRLTADGATEDRVVPVHRERALVQEQVAVLAQRVAEPSAGQLPRRLRLAHDLGERHAGAQRLVDARGAGDQRVAVDRCRYAVVPLLGPGDPAERQLHALDEVQRASYDGPEPLDEPPVAADQPVVPDPDRQVGAHVGLAAGVLDLARHDLHRPRAVGALGAPAPLVGRAPQPRPRRRPTAPSPPRRGSTRRRGAPTVQGTAPSGSCIATIEAAVSATCGGGQDAADAGHLVARTSEASLGLVQVQHHALADQRVERPLGGPGQHARRAASA